MSRESTSETHTNAGASINLRFLFVGASLSSTATKPRNVRVGTGGFSGSPTAAPGTGLEVMWYCIVGGRRRGTLDPRWLALMCGYIS